MTKARIVNLCFQVLAAFWAVIVITRARTAVPWHAYLIAAVGIAVISATGTRLKHRIRSKQKVGSSRAAVTVSPQQ